MPLLTRRSVLLADIESTSYTGTLLGVLNGQFNAYDVSIQPDVNMVPRLKQGSFDRLPDSPGARMGTATFRLDFVGDNAAGVPTWASTFLPACGMKQAGGSFTFDAVAPSDGGDDTAVRTISIAAMVDGTKRTLRGCMGTFTINCEAGNPIFIDFTFTGAWSGVSDVALPAPTYPTVAPTRWSGSQWTLGSETPCLQSMTIDAGNNVVMRECQSASDGTGYKGALITDRETTMSINPESDLVANQAWPTNWLAGTTLVWTDAMDNGNDSQEFGGTLQIRNDQQGDRNGIVTDEMELLFVDDSFSITFTTS